MIDLPNFDPDVVEPVSIKLQCQCRLCDDVHVIDDIVVDDLVAWSQGKLIQEAMPYLSNEERELLISQTCPACWSELFGCEWED